MTRNVKSLITPLGAACLAAALGTGGLSGCSQQGMSCTTAHGPYTVKLAVRDNPDSCETTPGGVFGLATYNEATAEGRPDFDRTVMAIQSEDFAYQVWDAEGRLGEAVDPDGPLYATGAFTTSEPENGVCTVGTLTPAKKSIPTQPAIPETPDDPQTEEDESDPGAPAVPAQEITYEWSNMRFLVSEANQGTRFVGSLTITVNGCAVQYDAVGLYPAAYCDVDEEGNGIDELCDAEPNEVIGPIGSGISPDFVTQCDPDLFLCVLTEAPLN